MAKNVPGTFDLNYLWNATATQTSNGGPKRQVVLSIFRRKASLSLFESGNGGGGGKLVTSVTLSSKAAFFIAGYLKALKTASAPVRLSFVERRWDRAAKKYADGSSLVFYRDDNGCYGFEFIPAGNGGNRADIKFNGVDNFSDGPEPISEGRKSELGLDHFYNVLVSQLPFALLLSRLEGPEDSNNSSGGNNYRSNGGNSGGFSDSSDVWN